MNNNVSSSFAKNNQHKNIVWPEDSLQSNTNNHLFKKKRRSLVSLFVHPQRNATTMKANFSKNKCLIRNQTFEKDYNYLESQADDEFYEENYNYNNPKLVQNMESSENKRTCYIKLNSTDHYSKVISKNKGTENHMLNKKNTDMYKKSNNNSNIHATITSPIEDKPENCAPSFYSPQSSQLIDQRYQTWAFAKGSSSQVQPLQQSKSKSKSRYLSLTAAANEKRKSF